MLEPLRSSLAVVVVSTVLSAVTTLVGGDGPTRVQADEYPADITPPAGTQYSCALTALPRALPGIPAADHAYLNRTYAAILRATHAKLVALKALESGGELRLALARYQDATRPLALKLAEPPPAGLAAFQEDVLQALTLHQAFFAAAVAQRADGRSMDEVYAIPQGRQASAKLASAWSRMQARYPGWSSETKDSLHDHLRALDLF
jgi:hypothetical protein